MKITRIVQFSEDALINRLKRVTMTEDETAFPYEDATIKLHDVVAEDIDPAQRYILKHELEKVRDLRWALADHGVDLFNIQGFVRMHIEGEQEPIDLLPPIVERGTEANGKHVDLLNDGMHRVYLARLCHSKIRSVGIQHIPKEYPYYAYPIPGNNPWDQVEMLDNIPVGYIKKWYRTAEPKKLYRNFNSAFMNIGGSRGYNTSASERNELYGRN